jgi:site-specific DNA recombinase
MRSVPQTPKRAILYTRVSGHEQVKGFSLRQQLDALRAYCDSEGIEVVGVFEDPGVSGSTLERSGLAALRDRVAEGEVDLVLAQDLDRISRMEAWRYEYLKSWFADHGVRVRYLEGSDDDDTPMGKFIAQIRHAHAELERDDIRRRMTRGRLQRAREGNVIGSRSPPFGFAYNADRTNYVVDEAAMALVRRIFGLFAERNSVRGVKAVLEGDGIRTPTGGRWWSRQTLRQMILRDAYKPHTFGDLQRLASGDPIPEPTGGSVLEIVSDNWSSQPSTRL